MQHARHYYALTIDASLGFLKIVIILSADCGVSLKSEIIRQNKSIIHDV